MGDYKYDSDIYCVLKLDLIACMSCNAVFLVHPTDRCDRGDISHRYRLLAFHFEPGQTTPANPLIEPANRTLQRRQQQTPHS